MPTVSIGMPVYNAEQYVEEAIQAILDQTYTDYELIICDNASTDGSPAICQRYAAQNKKIRYYRNQENLGGPRNFSKSFELSSGMYFKWATADDVSAPILVEKCVDVLKSSPEAVLCFGRTELINETGATIGPYEDKLDLQQSRPSERLRALFLSIGLCNAHYGVMRSDALRRTRLFRNFLASDYILLAELCLQGKFFQLPEVTFHRRFHREASSWDRSNMAKQVEFWSPSKRGKTLFPRWRHHYELCAAIRRTPLPVREKLACLAFVLRRMAWERQTLGAELFSLVKRSRRTGARQRAH